MHHQICDSSMLLFLEIVIVLLNASSPFFQWIMDVLLCNGLGIYCGMKTLGWLSLKTYKWQGLWNIPTYKYVQWDNLITKMEQCKSCSAI